MWIIPSNHPLYSAFAPECVASKEDLNELSDQLKSELMWKSKVLSSKIWSSKWSKVYWLPHLFGRMLKIFRQNSFTEKLTASLEDILAKDFHMQEKDLEQKTLDTYGPTFSGSLVQLDLSFVSSKMSKDISASDLEKSDLNYKAWVIKLKREYSLRLKLAHHTREKDYSSSQWKTPQGSDGEGGVMYEKTGDGHFKLRDHVHWTTPTATDSNRNTKYQQGGTALNLQAKLNWPTPTTMETTQDQEKFKARAKRLKSRNNGKDGTKRSGNGAGMNLATKVQEVNWPTARVSDSKDSSLKEETLKKRMKRKNGVGLSESIQRLENWPTPTFAGNNQGSIEEWGGSGNKFRGLQDPEKNKPRGNRLVLNPAWVMSLMGIHIEKTFFAWPETQSYRNALKKHP